MQADGGGASQAVGSAQLPTNLTSHMTADSRCGRPARPVNHTDHEFSAFLFHTRPFTLPQALAFNHLEWFSLELLRLPHRLL